MMRVWFLIDLKKILMTHIVDSTAKSEIESLFDVWTTVSFTVIASLAFVVLLLP
jgi:hypothetical protein